jgi:hypothetical protein
MHPLPKIDPRPDEAAAPPRAGALYNNANKTAKQESRGLVATGAEGFDRTRNPADPPLLT